jgi:hypothetical protein
MLRADTKSMQIKQRIWKQKLLLARSILKKEKSLAREVYQQQVERGWPGLSQEVEEICKKVGIPNINKEDVSKEEIEEAVFFHNYKEMKESINEYEKLEDIKHEDMRELPDYMKEKGIEKSRMTFRVRSKMVKTIKMNYKSSHRNNLLCDRCDLREDETQCHTMMCPGWKDQRTGLDLSRLDDMVTFFTRILEDKDKGRTVEDLASGEDRSVRETPSSAKQGLVEDLLEIRTFCKYLDCTSNR